MAPGIVGGAIRSVSR